MSSIAGIRRGRRKLVLFGVLLGVEQISAAPMSSCDCSVRVGVCQGAIEFLKSYGSKPSFGAQFIVHSNHGQCSKVEYYINNSPAQTILVNKFEEQESTFGTSPIKESDITFKACYICQRTEKESSDPTADARPRENQNVLPGYLNGRWCTEGRPDQWNVWRVSGGTLYTQHANGTTGSFSFAVTGENTFTVDNTFAEKHTILSPTKMHMKSFMISRNLVRCD